MVIESIDDVNKENLNQEMELIKRRLKLNDYKEALKFPKYFQIETTKLCNARCPFCPSSTANKSTPFMSDSLFEKIAKEIGQYGEWVTEVLVQRLGEPLIDPKIAERIHLLKKLGVPFVGISTNISLLDEKKAKKILEAGIDEVMLSIDSIHREEYAKLRVGLDYDTVIRNIERFFELRDKLKPDTIIRVRGVYFGSDNAKHIKKVEEWENFWNRFKRPHDRIYMKRAHNWGNQQTWGNNIKKYDLVYHPCILPWSTFHITVNGTVALCPQDYEGHMNIGNINKQTIAEVWRSEKFNNIRKLHQIGRRNDISFCQGCRVFDLDYSLEKKKPVELTGI